MKEYKVEEMANLLGKHEETIKRWIRSGKFPNAYRNNDKEGKDIHKNTIRINEELYGYYK